MGIKYCCDVCGKEKAVGKGGLTHWGQEPPEWVLISISLPQKPRTGFTTQQIMAMPAMPAMPITALACSLPCAEKALDEAKEQLRQAFEKLK